MTTRNQRHGFFVIHAHVAEGRADSCCCRKWFAAVIRAFRVNVNQAHLGCTQRCFRQRFRMTVSQPGFFITPVNIQIRFPDEGTEAGVFQRHVTREDKQVGPGDFLAIFLFDWPQQATRFIEAYVIRPGVQRCKTLLTTTRAAATVD